VEISAEELLRKFQNVLLERAQAGSLTAGALSMPGERPQARPTATSTVRQTVRLVERTYGPLATQYGRRLQELLTGSYAWDLFERSKPRRSRLPQMHELSRSEPLLLVMRESGELDERERLLVKRDTALVETWRDVSLSEIDRQDAAAALETDYAKAVRELAEKYRPYYHRLRRATGAVPPLTGPRVRSRPLLQPPVVAHFFAACHAEKDLAFLPDPDGGVTFRLGRNYTRVLCPKRHEMGNDEAGIGLLDDMAWDIAAIAVSAYFVRTAGSEPDEPFPLLIDDYFDWRGVDPRKRTVELRKEIDARIQFLFSDQLQLHSEMDLWLADAQSGRRKKTPIISDGPFLERRTGLYRLTAWLSEVEHQPLYGYMVALGPWAKRYIEERAMIGIFPKCLAEYDLRRSQWERRIGWYITFQMHNQGSRMLFEDIVDDKGPKVRVTPQHPLRMRSVLTGGQVRWEEMARTNPGKVIKQWIDALDRLKADGVIGGYRCLDGAPDGSDLPVRSRLSSMLEYRYEFTPGTELLKHIRAKSERRTRRKSASKTA
jgi:hypothetical protein